MNEDAIVAEALSIAISVKRERADEKGADPATARRLDREADIYDEVLSARMLGMTERAKRITRVSDRAAKSVVDWLSYFRPEVRLDESDVRKLRDEWIEPAVKEILAQRIGA